MIHDTKSAQISQKQDGRNIYMQSWKKCAFAVITTMALCQHMHLVTCCTVTYCALWFIDCIYILHIYIAYILLWLHIYITAILIFWDLSTLCVVDHLWSLVLCSLLSLLSTLWLICTSKCNSTWCAQVH